MLKYLLCNEHSTSMDKWNVIIAIFRSSNEVLVCRTQPVTSQQMTSILLSTTVTIDDVMISVSKDIDGTEIGLLRFTFLSDPTVTMVTPRYVFKLIVLGSCLMIVVYALVLVLCFQVVE